MNDLKLYVDQAILCGRRQKAASDPRVKQRAKQELQDWIALARGRDTALAQRLTAMIAAAEPEQTDRR